MKDVVFRGAGVAIITPFTEEGINFEELGRVIEDQIAGGEPSGSTFVLQSGTVCGQGCQPY